MTGLGGVGKTQTALQFAFWVRHEKPEYSIFWLSALSSTRPGFQSYPERLSELQEVWTIVDNADEMDLIRGEGGHSFGIDEQLPQSATGQILSTTRSNEVALAVSDEEPLELGEMELEEALKFLGKSITSKLLLADHSLVSELLEELTYLPLAIAQAAAYLNRNKVTTTRYLGLLRGTEQEMTSLLSREFPDRTRYRESKNAVATTWLVSFDHILAHDPIAASLLRFISRIEPKDIPLSILPRGELEEELTYSVGTLCAYTFLVPREGQEVYDMHSLVHLATRIWVQKSGLASKTTMDAYKHLVKLLRTGPVYEPYSRQYISHALGILRSEDRIETRESFVLSHEVCLYLLSDGRVREADECYRQSYDWGKMHLPENDLDRLEFEDVLSTIYVHRGQVDKAIELFQHVVAIHERSCSFEKDANPHLQALRKLKGLSYIRKDMRETAGILRKIAGTLSKLPSGHSGLRKVETYKLIQKLYEAEDGTKPTRMCRLIRQYYLEIASQDQDATAIIKKLAYEIEILIKTAPSSDRNLLFKVYTIKKTRGRQIHLQRVVELAQYMLAMVESRWAATATIMSAASELMIARTVHGGPAARVRELEYVGPLWAEGDHKVPSQRLAFQNQMGEAFLEDGQTLRGVSILRHTAKTWKAAGAWDGNHQLLEVQHNLGMAYHRLGHRRRAMELLGYVAEFRGKTLPKDNMRRVKTEKLLDVVQKEMEEAEKTGGR
ncbi:hypothetical protein CEP54_012103 [Fusarium duplospermum]|uniref:NB-ARC domain-containing protein n=1 Tax=Fusarium duplospermum TaxID=1325734 RepID=A0A428PAQ1_9HYPO|nr:hypothetical protein CEP54_012103 [Fusarium duplospermum]